MSNARTGKIARAPFEVRTRVNEMLRDGKPAAAVIKFLESAGIAEVEPMNVTNWRQGGHQEWLAEKQREASEAETRDWALRLVEQNKGSQVNEATLVIIGSQVLETLRSFDIAGLKDLLKEKPESYEGLVRAVTASAKAQIEAAAEKRKVAEQKAKIEAVVKEGNKRGGISPENMENIIRELRLM